MSETDQTKDKNLFKLAVKLHGGTEEDDDEDEDDDRRKKMSSSERERDRKN